MYVNQQGEPCLEDLRTALAETLFLGKFIDQFDGFAQPGIDYSLIVARGDGRPQDSGLGVWEEISGKREKSTSRFFEEELFSCDKFKNMLKNSKFIWTYQPYLWTDDLSRVGYVPLVNSWPLYEKLRNKFAFNDYLANSGNPLLQTALSQKLEFLGPKFVTPFDLVHVLENFESSKLIRLRTSNGGDGILVDPFFNGSETSLRTPVVCVENFLDNCYSVTQSAAVFNQNIIKYPPGVQVITWENERLHFYGTDYFANKYLDTHLFSRITRLTHAVGEQLQLLGYRGIFGCDYLVSPGRRLVLPIDLNPRYQATTHISAPPLSELDESNENALYHPHLAHLAAFLGFEPEDDQLSHENASLPTPQEGQHAAARLSLLEPNERLEKTASRVYRPKSHVKVTDGAPTCVLEFAHPIVKRPQAAGKATALDQILYV